MKVYMISYDLNKQGQNYDSLYKLIKGLAIWWHHLDSTWLVATKLTAVEIRDMLSSKIDDNDELLVARLGGEAAWRGFNSDGSEWLSNQLSAAS